MTSDVVQPHEANRLHAVRLGIDAQQEAIIFMRKDCHVCRAEGFSAHARILVSSGERSVIATLFQVTSDLLGEGEAGLSESAWRWLALGSEDAIVTVAHPRPVNSMNLVRGKIYGRRLEGDEFDRIVRDISRGRFSDIDLSAFITACSAQPLDLQETTALTGAMVNVGDRLAWPNAPIADKHCVGGLPGNRTTPIVVAIVSACGVTMPKTSSRAITSPAGTADAMETLAPVTLDLQAMRRVVDQEGGCIVWGGAVRLSPVDDTLIRVERALDIDSQGQLIASVLSKKVAAGASHVVLDLPVGPTAKVRGHDEARTLANRMTTVCDAFAMTARIVVSDGRQPVGRGIGPALEARDVLAVLRREADAPTDLRERAVTLAGNLLDLVGTSEDGHALASGTLADGRAWRKFQAICAAQGGMREPPLAAHRHDINADRSGVVASIDNRHIAKVAKLAGAPDAKAAGVELHVRLGTRVAAGQPLYTINAESPGELAYAGDYSRANPGIFQIID